MAKSKMSDEHKQAIADGRRQNTAVSKYLSALDDDKPRRGRSRTRQSIDKRIEQIDRELAEASSIVRLQLVQERLDLTDELSKIDNAVPIESLERDFVEVAAAFGDRKGISYQAWRQVGVPAAVLKRAGVSRAATR